ncbi:MAG TPA: dihydropteroate synthase [Candidatus Cybelea sp.]|jgi:dihydropteroate synthase|nr:dihydropteroate synthase [Candidatus Cybelea sp.]
MVRTRARVSGALELRGARLAWGERTYLMGIVNVTPDSFSGDGVERGGDATRYALSQWDLGADLLDFGGESTRPGHVKVAQDVEVARVVPVIEAVRRARSGALISIDTYKPEVARAAHAAGADLINSVWGAPAELLDVAAELQMPIVAMHNQNGTQYERPVVDAVLAFLEDCATRATARGIARERVILDPGIGFGKDAEQNLAVLAQLDRLVALGFPTMIGTSRKSTIGRLTGKDVGDRVYGTVATTALAIAAGIDVVRVHDVAAAKDSIAVADAIVRGWRPQRWIE